MNSKQSIFPSSTHLTKYPLATLREFVAVSLPLTFMALSASLLLLCDRHFLTKHSIESWEACSTASNLCLFFQIPCIVIALFLGQAFVGHFKGANKKQLIGPYVWQMIWFSFLSMVVTYPMSFLSDLYFKGSEIKVDAASYFNKLAMTNFLYPLAASLSSFFIGCGKPKPVFMATIFIQLLNIILDYFLISGINGIIPPLGILGAVIATIISQSTLCIILFILFTQKRYVKLYRTDIWKFNWKYLSKVLKKGLPHALGRVMALGSWIFASRAMVEKGGDYLLTLSFGTNLFLIFSFVNEGIGQALITLISFILGAKAEVLIGKTLRFSVIFLASNLLILIIPLFFFQDSLIAFFVTAPISENSRNLLHECCIWIWFICLAHGINRIGTALIIASKDTFFYACTLSIFWITLWIPIYIGIKQLGWSPPRFFLLEGINTLTFGFIYYIRFRKKIWEKALYHQLPVVKEA